MPSAKPRVRTILSLIVAISFLSVTSDAGTFQGQSIGVRWVSGSLDSALSQAKKQNKKVMAFVFATWCEYCSVMEKDVLSLPEISDYINASYIPVRLENSSVEAAGVREKYYVSSYPTFLFLKGDGSEFDRIVGQVEKETFLSTIKKIYNNISTYNIRVVNLSLNSTIAQPYHTSPLDAAVEILWLNGITVVVAAGNNGTGAGPVSIYPPANDPFVITVGATDDKGTTSLGDDTMAAFSAYGATEDGFAKPDLVAPGRNLISPLSDKTATIYNAYPLHRVGENYLRMTGTSMSAPVVSGAVALLLQDEPNLTPDQVKYRLMATANNTWSEYSTSQSGAGYLDVYAAVNGTTTESANTGIMVSQMLTSGSEPITWGSVSWNSVSWNSVSWNSVSWNSAIWDQ